jgi:hypothetical protein
VLKSCKYLVLTQSVHQLELPLRTAYGFSQVGELPAKTVPEPVCARCDDLCLDLSTKLGHSHGTAARTGQSKVAAAIKRGAKPGVGVHDRAAV